jgi:NADH dehydrogenase [ubiquinone] 1 alpha subcomplex assembly factor 7
MRAARNVPGFIEAARIALVEASPLLRSVQERTLSGWTVTYHAGVDDAPPGPILIVANEYLDCMSVHQAVRTAEGWRERQIGLSADGPEGRGRLRFGLGPGLVPPDDVSPRGPAAVGQQVEWAPGLEAMLASIARRLSSHDGRALFIDYGPTDHAPCDTLRAYQDGRQVDPLAAPGACDLTADVDFTRLARLARLGGLEVSGPVTQMEFLARLGITERARKLAAANPARADQIAREVAALTDREAMGERFKAICFAPGGAWERASPPPGF